MLNLYLLLDNPKLATLSGASAVKDNGTSTSATSVDIHQNALVA